MLRQDSVTKFVIYGKLHTKLNLPLLSLGYFFNSQTFKQFYICGFASISRMYASMAPICVD
jgi:hypothetical protein